MTDAMLSGFFDDLQKVYKANFRYNNFFKCTYSLTASFIYSDHDY